MVFQGPLIGFEKLQDLNLESNLAFNVKDFFFSNLTELLHLNLAGNNLRDDMERDTQGKIFRQLHSLLSLNMSRCNLNR